MEVQGGDPVGPGGALSAFYSRFCKSSTWEGISVGDEFVRCFRLFQIVVLLCR